MELHRFQRYVKGLKTKVQHLGLDLDRMSKYNLLLLYFKCKRIFPDAKIDVKISASGKGFHIIVHKEMTILENMLWRAQLNDDDRRLIYSISKFAISPDLPFFDLMFDSKYGIKATTLDLEKMLEPHAEVVKKIEEVWGEDDEALWLIKKLSTELEIKITRYWATSFKIKDKIKDKIIQVSKDIQLIDESFRWRVFPNFLGYGYIFIIYSPDMDTAQKRGTWLINKVPELKKHRYWVRRI